MRQIDSYQADMTDAQEDLARATGALVAGEEVPGLSEVLTMVTGRISRAEEGIRQQREVIVGLNGQVEKAIADAGLSDSDLAYLNLGNSQ